MHIASLVVELNQPCAHLLILAAKIKSPRRVGQRFTICICALPERSTTEACSFGIHV